MEDNPEMKVNVTAAIVFGTLIATPAAAQFGRPPSAGGIGQSERLGTFDPNRKTERDSYDYSNASAQVRAIAERIERAARYRKISDREADSLHRDLRGIVRMEEKATSDDPTSDERKALKRSYDRLDGRVKLMERNDMLRDRNRAEDGQFHW